MTADDTEGVRLRTAVTTEERGRLLALLPPGASRVAPGGIVALLGTDHDLPAGDLQAGQALQRLLWTAAAVGLVGTVPAGPVEMAGARGSARSRGGLGVVPQVLVHIDVRGEDARSGLRGSEDPPRRDRSHCRPPVPAGEPRHRDREEGTR